MTDFNDEIDADEAAGLADVERKARREDGLPLAQQMSRVPVVDVAPTESGSGCWRWTVHLGPDRVAGSIECCERCARTSAARWVERYEADLRKLEIENDRLREAMREARALLHEVRPQSMRAAAVLSKALDPIADLDPMAHGEVAEMARRRATAETGNEA